MESKDDYFVTNCVSFRESIAAMCHDTISFKEAVATHVPQPGENRGEEMANIMLAYRHLEDAAMRFGKAIQAHTTGVSPLGGPTTPGTAGALVGGAIPLPPKQLPSDEDDGEKAAGNQ